VLPGEGGKEAGVPTTDHDRDHKALDEQECLRLFGTSGIGRVAYTEAALPALRAVSYALLDGDVVIPARGGSGFAHAARGAVVAFEADSYDEAARTGWSVTVVGPSRVVTAGRSEDPGDCFVAVKVTVVHGWRTTAPGRVRGTVNPVRDAAV
jgi:hypothetical protein